MSLETPGNIGPYRLLSIVNTGQTSRIWQAYHDRLQKRFALKTLLSEYARNREHVHYLRWEYVVAGKLEHPNIIRVQEFNYDKGIPYLSLEWFLAPNLKQFLRQDRSQIDYLFPKIIHDGTEALTHFASFGWVHRDIKPDNVLVGPEGEVKLIDFALATKAKKGLARVFSRRSRVQGTRSYMSPEQILGKPLDERADLYSWACTIFEVVCGRPPFTGFSGNELLQKHLSAAVPNLEAFNRNITPEFSKLVRSAMAKRPSQRPESIHGFRDALKNTPIFRHTPRAPKHPAENL